MACLSHYVMVSEVLIGRTINIHTLHYGVDLKMLAHSESLSLPVIALIHFNANLSVFTMLLVAHFWVCGKLLP